MAPAWQILILGDISPARHIKLVTGEPTEVDVIDMSQIGMKHDGLPEFINEVPGPRVRRQVWLRTTSGKRLGYATSWWEAGKIEDYLRESSVPIWDNLHRIRVELFRDIRKILYGNFPELEQGFGYKGPFWGRYYIFFHQNKPLTVIYEAFSPYLSTYIGNSRKISLVTT